MTAQDQYPQDLIRFLEASPTAFHAVATVSRMLEASGFIRLFEEHAWGELSPGAYYVTRNDSSLMAFILENGAAACQCLRMAGAHTDSPAFKVKPAGLYQTGDYAQLGVEVYGGPMQSAWLDRDCSLAGRVFWQGADGRVRASLLDCKRPLAVMPSLAPHMQNAADRQALPNLQSAMAPILALGDAPDFSSFLREELRRQTGTVCAEKILAFDLFLYDAQPPDQLGLQGEFVCSARLDNLLSCHALVQALRSVAPYGDALIVLHDHEEVGSTSNAGARGSFLRDVLTRLFAPERLARILARSLFVSADNAHALHPNFPGHHEPRHAPCMGGGPVIKTNANQRYATTAATAAFFMQLCARAGVPCQQFVMRNDMPCGSTIGPFVAASLGVAVVDVGTPQLAMHSVRETAAWLDGFWFMHVMQTFFAAETELLAQPVAEE